MTTMQTTRQGCDAAARVACRRVIDELCERLHHAESLLHSLHRAKADSESRLEREHRADALKAVTGRSSLEGAIDATRRLIDRLRGAIDDAEISLASAAPISREFPARLRAAALSG